MRTRERLGALAPNSLPVAPRYDPAVGAALLAFGARRAGRSRAHRRTMTDRPKRGTDPRGAARRVDRLGSSRGWLAAQHPRDDRRARARRGRERCGRPAGRGIGANRGGAPGGSAVPVIGIVKRAIRASRRTSRRPNARSPKSSRRVRHRRLRRDRTAASRRSHASRSDRRDSRRGASRWPTALRRDVRRVAAGAGVVATTLVRLYRGDPQGCVACPRAGPRMRKQRRLRDRRGRRCHAGRPARGL